MLHSPAVLGGGGHAMPADLMENLEAREMPGTKVWRHREDSQVMPLPKLAK